jgi:hypothetical protein
MFYYGNVDACANLASAASAQQGSGPGSDLLILWMNLIRKSSTFNEGRERSPLHLARALDSITIIYPQIFIPVDWS